MARAAGFEDVLAELAALLGVGRDIVLGRALRAYRKLSRGARRAGVAPETLLADLCRMHDERTLRAEIDSLRATVSLLRAELEGRRAALAGRREPAAEASAAELFRQFRSAKARKRLAATPPVPVATDAAAPEPVVSPADRSAKILTIPGFSPDAQRALQSVAAAANAAAPPPAPAAPEVIFTPVAAPSPTPEGRLDYAERRSRVPKVTF
jgi:hypothetical protein